MLPNWNPTGAMWKKGFTASGSSLAKTVAMMLESQYSKGPENDTSL
jgi:hypothetical protein